MTAKSRNGAVGLSVVAMCVEWVKRGVDALGVQELREVGQVKELRNSPEILWNFMSAVVEHSEQAVWSMWSSPGFHYLKIICVMIQTGTAVSII